MMRRVWRVVVSILVVLLWHYAAGLACQADETGNHGPVLWSDLPPAGCPFPKSTTYKAVSFPGRWASYTNADTWYLSWASDGNCYSPWTDGSINGFECTSFAAPAATGQAKVAGSDPMKLTITNLGRMTASQSPHGGRYPCGSLVHDGVWYYGSYTLDNGVAPGAQGNWNLFGPFVGFRYSTDWDHLTTSWADGYWTQGPLMDDASQPLLEAKRPVRIGSPHFVDFGQNMKHSPDGKGYLVSHGAETADAVHNWIEGDSIYLTRVKPSITTINDKTAYEYYAGSDSKGEPKWSGNYSDIKPILSWPGHLGCVTITYNAPHKRYLMCITKGKSGQNYDTMILESKKLTGPWSLVHYLQNFGPQAYFVNIPSKFISKDGKSMWLCYSANFERSGGSSAGYPIGSSYALCLQEMRLYGSKEPLPQRKGTIEAESFALSGSASVISDKLASGGSAVSGLGPQGSALELAIVARASQLHIRYSASRQSMMALYINGIRKQQIGFEATGGATGCYTVKSIDVYIPAGAALRLQCDADGGDMSVDTISIGSRRLINGKIEAEAGAKLNGAADYTDPAASGGQIVAYLNIVGSSLEFANVMAANRVTIRYATINNGTCSLYINGRHVRDINISSTGAWTGQYMDVSVDEDIPKGSAIRVQCDIGDVGINVDYIRLEMLKGPR